MWHRYAIEFGRNGCLRLRDLPPFHDVMPVVVDRNLTGYEFMVVALASCITITRRWGLLSNKGYPLHVFGCSKETHSLQVILHDFHVDREQQLLCLWKWTDLRTFSLSYHFLITARSLAISLACEAIINTA